MPHLSANTWSPSLCRWRGFTMTAGGLRLVQDLRRSLLEPARQLRPRTATKAAAGDAPKPSEPPRNLTHDVEPTPAHLRGDPDATPEETTVNTVSSHDGTTIGYDKVGEGPALILVDGALSVHSSGGKSELAKLLAPHFTVYGYDRRGRGGSGDTLPYAVDREIEDIEALIDHAGGSAFLYGHSSGGTLAMQAAVRLGRRVSKIAMYEPPHNDDPDAQESWSEYLRELGQVLADGRRGDAVALFMRFVGTPDDQVEGMRQAPFWPGMEAIAPTLAYDHAAIIGERWSAPTGLAARVSVPALVIAGDASLPFMPHTARALSKAMPHGHLRMLEGQTHDVNPGVLASVLVDFFTS